MDALHSTFTFFLRSISGLLLLLCSTTIIHSQESKSLHKLGSLEEFVRPHVESHSKSIKEQKISIEVADQKTFVINIQSNDCTEGSYYLFGKVDGYQNATFFIKGDDKGIKGKLLFYDNDEAYVISTNEQKEVFIEKEDIHSQVCIIKDTSSILEKQEEDSWPNHNLKNTMVPELESFPGAPGVLYLDFDGENVSGGSWGTINAAAAGLTDAEIEEVFYVISEDYAPFNINVTTTRSVYDNANIYSRQMIIFNNTYPSNPGVAILGSFNNGSGDPCWVKMGGPVQSPVKAANVGSHEAGHTFGLHHDGNASAEYYPGHGFYRVIMGTVTDGYSQFSKGEYSGANNSEDDLQIMSGNTNGVGYRTDDHGNDMASSTDLSIEDNGDVLESGNFGIIGQTMDVDLFKMEVGEGTINLEVRPANQYDYSQNLDLKVRLLDASGTEIASADTDGFAASTLNETVAEGTYYMEIDGVGFGDPLGDGYTDYGSLGRYFISGEVPPASLSVTDFDDEIGFQIFPNPANGEINIKHDFIQANYEIMTIHGASVIKGAFGSDYEKLDVSFLTKGVYLFNVKADNKIYTGKIVIK